MRNLNVVQSSGPALVSKSVFQMSGVVMGRETAKMEVMKLDVSKFLSILLL